MRETPTETQDAAEMTALRALAWIGETEDLMAVFLGSGGLSAEDLAGRLSDPALLAAVLDFILLDDAWTEGFAAEIGVPPHEIARLRQALPGGNLPNWT